MGYKPTWSDETNEIIGQWIAEFIAQLGTHNAQVMEEMKRPLPKSGGPGYKWYRPGNQEEQNEQNSVG